MSSQPVTTFWRVAGMSYLQYINKAASTIRGVLKEPAKTKALAQDRFSYNMALWEAGKQGPKMRTETMRQVGKA